MTWQYDTRVSKRYEWKQSFRFIFMQNICIKIAFFHYKLKSHIYSTTKSTLPLLTIYIYGDFWTKIFFFSEHNSASRPESRVVVQIIILENITEALDKRLSTSLSLSGSRQWIRLTEPVMSDFGVPSAVVLNRVFNKQWSFRWFETTWS